MTPRNCVVGMRCKSSIKNHFRKLCESKGLWRPMMHTEKKGSPDDFITLKEKQTIIKDQSKVAEILNESVFHKYYALNVWSRGVSFVFPRVLMFVSGKIRPKWKTKLTRT